jgi:hypothetical protein
MDVEPSTPNDPIGRGVPFADGRTRKPRHTLGKRKPRDYTYASDTVLWRPDENGELVPYKFRRKPTRKPGKIGVARDKDGTWIMQKRDA